MYSADGVFYSPYFFRLEGIVTGQGKPMGMLKVSEYGRLKGEALGEYLYLEGVYKLGFAICMQEQNGFLN